MLHFRRKSAFTLIELLIVVAIIAILAAIAVPNFLEAQTRAKVSRAKSDMRTLATALESYYVDNNNYVPSSAMAEKTQWEDGMGANEAFHAASAPGNPNTKLICEWWRDDSTDMSFWNGHFITQSGVAAAVGITNDEAYQAFGFEKAGNYALQASPITVNTGTWYINSGGGSGYFGLLSTPIAYISNSTLKDPWLNIDGGGASFIKYVACNKFQPIGFTGGGTAGAFYTSKTAGNDSLYGPDHSDIAPHSNGDDDFNAFEDSQILWWALYCVGPDKTDSIVVEDPGASTDDIRVAMINMWAASWNSPDAGSNQKGYYDLDDEQLAEWVGAHVYDPTNGTKSGGEIWRIGGGRPSQDATNSDGDNIYDESNNSRPYSVTAGIYQNLSQMVK